MINPLKSDDMAKRMGGKFKLAALAQRRLKELIEGARPLVDTKDRTLIEVVIQEIHENKIGIDYEKSQGLKPPLEEGKREIQTFAEQEEHED